MYASISCVSCSSFLLTVIATFSTMVGGVISDVYQAEDRNTPMALFSASAMFGTGLGPMFSGFVVQNSSWRWVFYSQAIVSGALLVLVVVFFKETRGSVLLSRKAKALNKYYEALEQAGYVGMDVTGPNGEKIQGQRIRWKVKSDEERETLGKMIAISLYRPFRKSPFPTYDSFKLIYCRPPRNRTRRLLLLPLGLLQLGSPLPPIRIHPDRLPKRPRLRPRAIRRHLRRYVNTIHQTVSF